METTKTDIATRADIELLMNVFYGRLLSDESIRFLFNDVAKIDLEAHLPRLIDFWQDQLLGSNHYSGNPMHVHMSLHSEHALTKLHFDTWTGHFNRTIDENFSGPKAHLTKERALSIATVMQIKISQSQE